MKPDSFPQEVVRRLLDMEKQLRDQIGKQPLFDIANEGTPAQLTGDQNDYDPGDYDVLRVSASMAVNITGISGGKKGRFLELINVGSFTITLQNESLSSGYSNRILTSTGAAVAIAANDHKRLYYDNTSNRWRV